MVTLFGDLFVEDADGAIHFTDTVEGAIAEQVCHSADDFDEILESDPDDINSWFKPDLVEEAQALGLRLAVGQCYGFKIHPQEGGEVTAGNLVIKDLYACVAESASLAQGKAAEA